MTAIFSATPGSSARLVLPNAAPPFATTGAVGEYATIETTFEESALKEVGDWVNWQVQYE